MVKSAKLTVNLCIKKYIFTVNCAFLQKKYRDKPNNKG